MVPLKYGNTPKHDVDYLLIRVMLELNVVVHFTMNSCDHDNASRYRLT